MKKAELRKLGFVEVSGGDWYQLQFRHHLFITNDVYFNGGEDQFHIGYQNTSDNEEMFWFNQKLTSKRIFEIIFTMLTGFYVNRLPKS